MTEPESTAEADARKVRRDLLVKWLRKVRTRRRTISTLLLRGWHR